MSADFELKRHDDVPQTRLQRIAHVLVRENWYRDVWLTVISAVLLWAAIGIQNTVDDVQEGRRFSVDVICSATSAVIDAGRETIIGGAQGVGGEFERNLRKLGYPPRPVRQRQADEAAQAYANAISRRVEQKTGISGVVREDGTLNCRRLGRLARIH